MGLQKSRIKYHVVYEPYVGEKECGDQYLVKELTDFVLIAVADGLGHGSEAAFAAKKAMQFIDDNANTSIVELVRTCSETLENTRGITLTIARITDDTLSYLAIGNVTGVCWQMSTTSSLIRQSILLEGGVVGYQLPVLKLKQFSIKPGDIFILATDGIKENFEIEPPNFLKSPEWLASSFFKKYRNFKDDGLILVAQII